MRFQNASDSIAFKKTFENYNFLHLGIRHSFHLSSYVYIHDYLRQTNLGKI